MKQGSRFAIQSVEFEEDSEPFEYATVEHSTIYHSPNVKKTVSCLKFLVIFPNEFGHR